MSAEKNHVLFLFYFTTYIIQDDSSRKRSFKAGVDDTARNEVQVTWSQEGVGQSTEHLPMRQVHALCRTKPSCAHSSARLRLVSPRGPDSEVLDKPHFCPWASDVECRYQPLEIWPSCGGSDGLAEGSAPIGHV